MHRIISIFLLCIFAETTSAHGGGLDANGGHFKVAKVGVASSMAYGKIPSL